MPEERLRTVGMHVHDDRVVSRPEPKPEAPAFRASQAVHVVIWREADGSLRVAPRGTAVSAVTIEALLVAPSSEVDLLAWLSPT